jgi:geranylgeranyl reductase family protein
VPERDRPDISGDVIVAGAGPAGAAAAITLSRAGREVLLVDKATFPRDKCCGDGLTTLALREAEALGLQPSAVPSWTVVREAWLRSPSGREVCLPLPINGQFAAITPRIELDHALVELAVKEGARLIEADAVTGVDQRDDAVDVTLASGRRASAAQLVAADGMWSPVRKALGLDVSGYLGEWHGFRQYATNVTGPAAERLYVWFDADLLPGYAWSFPLAGNRANVGFGLLRDGPRPIRDMKAIWPELLHRAHIRAALGEDAQMEGRHTAWPIPARVDTAPLASGRVLFAGDAAMATDALTGEGIGQAMLTGRLAAEAVLAAGTPDDVAYRYRESVRLHLFADHRMSVRLSRVLTRERGARGAIRVAGLNGWTRRNFARWMFEDEPRAIALTPRRWHRGFLRGPGAYRG